MRVLFIGDIVGRPSACYKGNASPKSEYKPNIIIANGKMLQEKVLRKTADELFVLGLIY